MDGIRLVSAGTPLIRIALVQHHQLVRAGLKALLGGWQGLEVVGEANGSKDAIAGILEWDPDIVLIDAVESGGMTTLELLSALREHDSRARSILLADGTDRQMLVSAVSLGAMGVVLKDQPPEMLNRAIRKVYDGEVWIERALTSEALRRIANGKDEAKTEALNISLLSKREIEVIAAVCQGQQNVAIGRSLTISEATVRHHLTSIYNKLNLKNRVELVTFALAQGIAKAGY